MKKYPAKDQVSLEQNWAVAQGTHNEKPLFVRYNTDAKRLIGHPEYAHQVGIAIPLHNPDQAGLPNNEEMDQLNEIEKMLIKQLESDNESLLVAVITTNGMRELILYTSDPMQVKEKMSKIKERDLSHELQMMIQPDKDWVILKQFVQ